MYLNEIVLLLSVMFGFTQLGSATDDQKVSVHPSVSTKAVRRTSRLMLDCPVTSASKIKSYTWTKNGVDLVGKRRVYLKSNGSLIISRRRKGQNYTGLYVCYATNKYGSFIGRQVEIVVAKRTSTIEPMHAEPLLGGVARFQCKLNTTFQKAPVIMWEGFEGSHFDDNPRISKDMGILHIHNVSREDEGSYTCKVVFHVFDETIAILDKSASLEIKSGPLPKEPQLLSTPQNITVIEGKSVLMECLVQGGTDVSITWQYPDGRFVRPLDNGRVTLSGTLNIRISHTISTDSGKYICVVKHSGGPNIMRTYTLDIQVAPQITDQSLPVYLHPLVKRERLFCKATGNPKPEIQWFKDGIKVYPAPGLQIENELVLYGGLEDSGYYQCFAKNSVGYDVSTTWVTFTRMSDTPEQLKNVVATAVSATEVNVTWSPAETPDGLIAYSIDYYPVHDFECRDKCVYAFERQRDVSKGPYKVISSLKPYTEYAFAIQAFSVKGAGLLSEATTVKTLEAVPTSVPNVEIIPDSYTSFRVTWTEIPMSDRHGIINRYELKYGTKIKMTVIELTGDITDYLVTGLEPETIYQVRVIAGNAAGYPDITDNWITYKTPEGNTSYIFSPKLTFKPLNSSAVLIRWNNENMSMVSNYRVRIQKNVESGAVREYNLSADKNHLYIGGLENRTFYEINFMMKSKNNEAMGSVTQLYQSLNPDDERAPPPPMQLNPVSLTSSKINLTWERPGPSMKIVKYTIRYQQTGGDVARYQESKMEFVQLEGLQPFTWYAFEVRSHTETRAGPFSKRVRVQTKEGIPSPPKDLVAEVISPGTVKLEWGPPSQQNGIITYYIIYYNPDKDEPDKVWSSIQQNASATSVLVGDLKRKIYYFKLRACTNAGEGPSSHIIELNTCGQENCPVCSPSQSCPTGAPPPKLSNVLEQRLGIIIGCGVGLVCIVFCVIFLCVRHRQLSARYTRRAETHIIHTSNDCHVGRYLSQQLQGQTDPGYSPILSRLPENENSDSKGGHQVVYLDGKVIVNGNHHKYFTSQKMAAEQRALLSPSTSSSQGNDTSGNPTPDTGTLDSSFTTPDSVDYDVSYNRIRNYDSLEMAGENNKVCLSNTAESCRRSQQSIDDVVKEKEMCSSDEACQNRPCFDDGEVMDATWRETDTEELDSELDNATTQPRFPVNC